MPDQMQIRRKNQFLVVRAPDLLDAMAFLIGLTSTLFLPYYHGLKIVDCFLVLSLLIFCLFTPIIRMHMSLLEMFAFFLMMVYFSVTTVGAINANSIVGIYVSCQYVLVFVVVCLFVKTIGSTAFLDRFLKGFFYSCILSSLWILVDTGYYYTHGFNSINQLLFPSFGEHDLTNRGLFHGMLILRAAGFGWDPGGIAPALAIAYILVDTRSVTLRYKTLHATILIVALCLTFSRNGFLVLLLYFVYKGVGKVRMTMNGKRLSLQDYFVLGFFITFFLYSVVYTPSGDADEGTVRHIKYFGSVLYYFNASVPDLLFGYGYRGTQLFFLKNVPFASTADFFVGTNSVVESTLTNLFLCGGLFGIAITLFVFGTIIFYGLKRDRTVAYFLLIAFIGYTIEGIWTNTLIYGLFLSALCRFQNHWATSKRNLQLQATTNLGPTGAQDLG